MPFLEDKKPRGKWRAEGTGRYDNYTWKKTSKAYRKLNPWCEVWLEFGHYVDCDCTDHIISVESGGSFLNQKNLMAMSNFWHNRKSNLEGSGLVLGTSEVRGGGKIPSDRNEIIRILAEKYKKEINRFE